MSQLNHGPPIARVGIIGATPLAIGIAMKLLDADIPVTVYEGERDLLEQGIKLARSAYQDAVTCGVLAAGKHDRRMGLLAGTVNFHHLKDCDLILDFASGDGAARDKLYRRLDQTVKMGTLLVSCTPAPDIDRLARCTRRQGEVLGLQLPDALDAGGTWQLVPGKGTSDESLSNAAALVALLHGAGVGNTGPAVQEPAGARCSDLAVE